MSGFSRKRAGQDAENAAAAETGAAIVDEDLEAAAKVDPGQTATATVTVAEPTDEQLAGMSRDELVELGGERDHVRVLSNEYVIEPGSPAERGAERRVALCFALAGVLALAFVIAYISVAVEVQRH